MHILCLQVSPIVVISWRDVIREQKRSEMPGSCTEVINRMFFVAFQVSFFVLFNYFLIFLLKYPSAAEKATTPHTKSRR